jgi:hypothetical protein
MGKASAYNFSSSEIKEELPLSSEDLQAANIFLFAFRDNPFQEIFDLNNKKSGNEISTPSAFASEATGLDISSIFYQRDLRRSISQQLFPKHFFL